MLRPSFILACALIAVAAAGAVAVGRAASAANEPQRQAAPLVLEALLAPNARTVDGMRRVDIGARNVTRIRLLALPFALVPTQVPARFGRLQAVRVQRSRGNYDITFERGALQAAQSAVPSQACRSLDPAVECRAFRARGEWIARQAGSAGIYYYWTECGVSFTVWPGPGKLTPARVRLIRLMIELLRPVQRCAN